MDDQEISPFTRAHQIVVSFAQLWKYQGFQNIPGSGSKVVSSRRYLRAQRGKLNAFGFYFRPVGWASGNGYRVSTLFQPQGDGDVWIDVAMRAGSGQDEFAHGHPGTREIN